MSRPPTVSDRNTDRTPGAANHRPWPNDPPDRPNSPPRHQADGTARAHRALARRYARVRIVFGLIWAIDATLKWQPGFRENMTARIRAAGQGQPHWLSWFFTGGQDFAHQDPALLAVLIALAETAICLGLVFGVLQRVVFAFGVVFAVCVWAVAEGFGGPYGPGSADIGAAIMYAMVFAALWCAVPRPVRADAPALDHLLARHWPWLAVLTFNRPAAPRPGELPGRSGC